ncbi:SRPBCC family protein [Simiduia curdlanivorans]|uniref:SRPBCC family protein n=1 Tax=Simiduia curdlanivorans TaxID=1492769 RepID=A0ABV8V4Z8_9GAMM|nr:SRPBCC family protein [Simiduia curdlanivorans]MDN3641014.1 SRPBCC family protein [Simiduia curdlanivorans]
MSHQHIEIELQFHCTPEALFQQLSDHVQFGKIVGANIQRIVDSKSTNRNGLGAVRRITIAPGLSFDETITRFDAPDLMEYRITRGSPVKEHWGRLAFKPHAHGCVLFYTIDFSAKLPGTGWLLKPLIEGPIRRGLTRLQATLQGK